MTTYIEFLILDGQDKAGDIIGSQLESIPVDVQPAVITINNRSTTFDGMRVLTTLTDGQNERTTRNSSGAQI
jgi:ribosomal protein L11